MTNYHFISYFNYSNNLNVKKKFRKIISKNFDNFFIFTPLYIKKNYPKLIWTTKNYKNYYKKKINKNNIIINTYWIENGLQSWETTNYLTLFK